MYQAVDWFVIIAELRKRGISRTKLAKKLGVSTSTVSAWFYCLAAPSHSNGEKLIAVWETEFGSDAPRVELMRR